MRGRRRRFLLFLGPKAVSACWAGPLGQLGGLQSCKPFPFFLFDSFFSSIFCFEIII
jgi:hypothetical protein